MNESESRNDKDETDIFMETKQRSVENRKARFQGSVDHKPAQTATQEIKQNKHRGGDAWRRYSHG